MEREELFEILKVIAGLFLLSLSLFLAYRTDLALEALVKMDALMNVGLWLSLFILTLLSLLGIYVLSSVKERRLFLAAWALALVAFLIFLRYVQLDDLALLSILLSGIMAHGKEVRRVGHVWEKLRSARGIATIVFLLLVVIIVIPNAAYYNDLFINEALRWSNSLGGDKNSLSTLIDALFPSTVTPEEVKLLEAQLASSIPEWNLLSPADRNVILSKAVEELIRFKEALKASIKASLSSDRPLLTKEALLALTQNNELLRTLIENLYLFLIFIALAIFSLVTEVATVVAFLILLPVEWWRTRKLPKEEGC
ncbi:MAG: hypothetical protein GXO00_01555 [Candidatus Diapherotrites archaeon]|nr:hypothetical protein [Candidatus Diapherotrites archaeon]